MLPPCAVAARCRKLARRQLAFRSNSDSTNKHLRRVLPCHLIFYSARSGDTVRAFSLSSDRLVLTFAQLHSALRIDADALQCALEVLLRKLQHCNGSLLLKYPKQAAILPLDKFKFNRKFQSKVAKLALPFTLREDTSAAAERAYAEKEQCLRAAIVRTLKARGTVAHRELVVEVTAQIKVFSAKARDIKRAIEKLIQDKYLERHPTIVKMYRYLR